MDLGWRTEMKEDAIYLLITSLSRFATCLCRGYAVLKSFLCRRCGNLSFKTSFRHALHGQPQQRLPVRNDPDFVHKRRLSATLAQKRLYTKHHAATNRHNAATKSSFLPKRLPAKSTQTRTENNRRIKKITEEQNNKGGNQMIIVLKNDAKKEDRESI